MFTRNLQQVNGEAENNPVLSAHFTTVDHPRVVVWNWYDFPQSTHGQRHAYTKSIRGNIPLFIYRLRFLLRHVLGCEGDRDCKVLDLDGHRDRRQDDIEFLAGILRIVCSEQTGLAYSAENNSLGLINDG